MDFLIILTILGFMISIYMISEGYKKRNLKFKIGFIDKIIFIVLGILLILLIFIENFYSIQNNDFILWQFNGFIITIPYFITILIFILAAIIIGIFFYKLNSKKILKEKDFLRNLEDLLNQRKFPEFTSDLIIYIKDQDKINKKHLSSLLSEILDNPEYILYITKNNLSFCLSLLKLYEKFDSEVFWNKIAKELMKDPSSRLYIELDPENNGNKPLTDSLFKNYKKAHEILLWKPIGDFVLSYLEEQSRLSKDKNNLYESRYDLKKLDSPIFIGIEFFRRMVHYGLNNNVKDHFWLSYYDAVVDSIVKNYNIEESTNKNAEFANMYEFYIYEIFSNYREWIKSKNYTVKLENISDYPEANIIKDSIISWTRSLKLILESDKVRYQFKIYLQNIYLETYFELALSKDKKLKDYSKVFIESLKNQIGGYGKIINSKIRDTLMISLKDRTSRDIWREKLHVEMQPNGKEKINNLIKTLNSIK